MTEDILTFLSLESWSAFWWIALGLSAQFAFSMRFIVQWIASERAGRSYVPTAFWYLSIIGGAMLLSYAIYRQDIVFIIGQAAGLIVYIRNLALIKRVQKAELRALAEDSVHQSKSDST